MISRFKLIVLSLTVMFVLALAFPLFSMAAAENAVPAPSCYDKMITRIVQEKGISVDEAKVQLDAKLSEIAKKKGISLEELKKQMAEGKFHKGHHKPLDEAKLKEIAKKKGITVEELKQRINQRHSDKAKALQ